MSESIGIIAGSGQFPRLVAEDAKAAGYGVVVCAFHGFTDPGLEALADAYTTFYLGQFDKVIDYFRKHGVRKLCMAGAINKPRALDLRPDFRAARILFSLRGKGDDALLRAIMADLEKEGFTLIQAAELSTSLLCPEGVLTRRGPSAEEIAEIDYGWPIAEALGRFDIGQCIVVKQGMVVAVECLEGTDAALRRGGELRGEGCVAIKRFKPKQDERVDLPSIGLQTVRLLIEQHYRCLAVDAGKTLFFDRAEALALADKHNFCIIALTEDSFGKLRPRRCRLDITKPERKPLGGKADRYQKLYPVTWDQLHRDAKALAWRLLEQGPFKGIIGVARGGLVPAAIVARELNIRLVDTLSICTYQGREQTGGEEVLKAVEGDGDGWLVVDDLVDTGNTATIIRNMLPKAHFATLYSKPAGKPLVDTFITEVSQDTWILFRGL